MPSSDRYETINTVPVFQPLLWRLRERDWWGEPLADLLVSRYSLQGEGVQEQLSKVLSLHSRSVPAAAKVLQEIPEEAWDTQAARDRYGIIPIRVRDVMDERRAEEPGGTVVIGHLLRMDSLLVFRTASSGYKGIQMADGEQRNPFTQAVIELLKLLRATMPNAPLTLRMSEDTTRKGRLAHELARLDEWVQRLSIAVYLGTSPMPPGMFGKLVSSVQNNSAEIDRRSNVARMIKGALQAATKGNLPVRSLGLPPGLHHKEDPTLSSRDPRVKDGAHFVVEWDVKVGPALADYMRAYAQGASGPVLAEVLRDHRFPTSTVSYGVDGKQHHPSVPGTTFDQLPPTTAAERARELMLSRGYHYTPVPPEASDEERAQIERNNQLALRKFTLLRNGTYLWMTTNPTPDEDRYGEFEVERYGPLDPGRIFVDVSYEWPSKPVLTRNDAGLFVVTAELERGTDGELIPWTHLGCDPDDIDAAIERVIGRSIKGRRGSRQVSEPRLLTIERWADTAADGTVRQYDLVPRIGEAEPHPLRYRMLVSRLAARPEDPLFNLNVDWSKVRYGLTAAAAWDPKEDIRREATLREEAIVAWVADTLEAEMSAILENDLEVRAIGSRTSNRRLARLTAALEEAQLNERRLRKRAEGYLDMAADARANNDHATELAHRQRCEELRDEADDVARLITELQTDIAQDDDSGVNTLQLDVRSVAHLIAILRRCAVELGGIGPQELNELLAHTFCNWRLVPDGALVQASCVARLATAEDGVTPG